MAFSTDKANAEFATAFVVPARAVLSGDVGDATAAYKELGRLWASAQRELERLPPGEAHVSPADSSFAADVKDAVHGSLGELWSEIKPKVSRGGVETHALGKRVSSIEAAYAAAIRGAIAHAAAAADRAAAAARPSVPVVHAMTPTADPPMGVPASVAPEQPAAEPDIVDLICQRMNADGASPAAAGPAADMSGNAPATTAQRAAAVPPTLARAATRLTSIGCPPLRVDPIGGMLATHILQSKPTFTDWVESKNLTGASLREGMTDARALDLATQEFGPAFLVSTPAEVLLRRLLSVVLASKMGNWKLSTFLEEIPGDSALAELPDSILKGLSERLKLEMKLEQLTGAKP